MEILLTSILAFISTNIDDVFLLMFFFGDKRFKNREIVIGQFLGIISLILISLAISFIGLVVDQSYIGLLGFLPIYFGLKALQQLSEKQSDEEPAIEPTGPSNILTVAGVTIANGGDNIGIYVPLFATQMWGQKLTMILIFLIMTAVWLFLAKYFTRHPLVANTIDKFGHIMMPFVLILLGIYILYECNTWLLISSRW